MAVFSSTIITSLTLGQFLFKDFEIPESIQFGGEQKLSVKHLVGGVKVVDALGFDHSAPSWSGVFLGLDAMDRATSLKALSQAGRPLLLRWNSIAYNVVIQSLSLNFRRPYHVPYSITCEVVSDLSGTLGDTSVTVTDAINQDAAAAALLCTKVGDPVLNSNMGVLTAAIVAVSDFSKKSQSALNAVLIPLAQVQSQVSFLLKTTENTLGNVATVGGLLPSSPVAKTVAQLGNYLSAAQSSPALVQLNGVLGRIGTNIGQLNSSVRTVTVPGGNLYDIASKEYGNAMGWTAIAAANPSLRGETQLNGVTTLVIPPYTNQSDGVTT